MACNSSAPSVFPTKDREKIMDEIVLSWNIEDVCNQDLYKDKVKKIPDEFHSVDEYFESYAFPLIEETRAELSSCLEKISESPVGKIQKIELHDTKHGLVCNMDILANGFAGGSEIYEPKNGDVFVLSSLKAEFVEDLLRYGVTYCLAIVKKVTEVEEDEVQLKRFAMSVSPTITSTDEIQGCTCAIFLMSTVTNSRIWRAITKSHFGVDENFTLIKKVLSRSQMGENISDITQIQGNPKLTRLLEQLTSFNLNQSQVEVIKSTISAVKCERSSSIKLVWGPPGTGKTKTVGSILWSLNQLKIRTLTCAPTNVAIAGVCTRLLQLLKNFDGKNGNSDGFPPSLSDVVLIGNRGRMDIVGDLNDVFLDCRVCHLDSLVSDWGGERHPMVRLLEDCYKEYNIFLENNKDGNVSLGFGDYLREQVNMHTKKLHSCFLTLFVHLPRHLLSSESCLTIVSLQGLLRELSDLLSSSAITEEQLKQTFQTPSLSLSTAQKKLVEAREECLKQLRHLQETLKFSLPFLMKCGSVRDFCLQNATLVFCTASTSFLLHNAEKTCFDVLVIDEAAQLKECESVIPLRLNHVKHALLVGDECQLPALVQSQASKRAGFGTSLFKRLVSLHQEKHLLNTQYRMHPSISLFPNNRFYDGKILDGPNVLEDGYNNKYSQFIFGSYAFVNIADGREETDDLGKSWRNWVEVAVVYHLIQTLCECWKKMKGKLTVGIISPYAAQVKAIKDKIGKKYYNDAEFEVRIKSIDGFQGEEDDVIILSTVRCNTKGGVGFLYDNQRTNVAITRARHCLWILGSSSTLSKSGTIWSDIVFDAEQRGCLFDAKDNGDLSKLILNVKNELDQLADLLNPNSVLFSSTRWKVLFSDGFFRSFAKLKSKHTRMGVIAMLLRLASGWRSKKKNLSMDGCSLPLRVYAVAELYLVWSVDLEQDRQLYTQIIKLWDLIPLAEVRGQIKRLNYVFSMYTDAYMGRCKTICIEGTSEVPMMWTHGREIVQYRKNIQPESEGEGEKICDTSSSFLENSKVSESLVLMRFYALSSGVVKYLLMGRDGSEIDVPFELNDQEMEIIRFPYSSFILGRSGTGKTTVLTTKLVRMEQQFFVASRGMGYSDVGPSGVGERGRENDQMEENVEIGFIKQVFLTVSPNLCSAIRNQVNRLVRYVNFGEMSGPIDSVTMHDKLDDFDDIPDNLNVLTENQYPLIITFRKFLMILDGTVRFSFFNKFCAEWGASMEEGVSKSRTLQALIQSKEVDFDKFSGSYWPHFNEKLTKNLDASTVFTQIISHIKGGFGSTESALGREQYVSLSEKRFSSLDSAVRERIYDIFLHYEKMKRTAKEFDLSDFVNNLLSHLNTDGCMSCKKVDYIYIDEVQDMTVRQIKLLKHVCNNFKGGFVFAGDTAQTIARGVDFRFEDVRSLFYKEFLSELKGKEKDTHLSDTFQLCQNFRTHVGVLHLAQSVIDLLCYFFPFSVDKLKPETSLIYGGAPVLLESGGDEDENVIIKIFGGSESSGGRPTEFGAEQVILVRDDSAKKEILDTVGKRALVLTIIECKGLEFQDVLLYNFFTSSPLENKWRVLYGYLESEDILDPSMTRSYPKFDIAGHHLLCSELKQLYVAITRTRQRLWICENSKEFCKPMFDYWKRLCLVQGTQLDTNFIETMRNACTPDEWRVRGIKLFNERRFEMARICFEKAGDVFNENWARAAGLVERAERDTIKNSGNALLQKAADIYEKIRMFDKAATCYIKLQDYAKAGMIYLEKFGTSRLEDAGDCFVMIKCWQRAADVYFQGKCFSKCISACSNGELFNTGLNYLEKWRLEEEQGMNKWKFQGLEALREDYIMNCANRFHQRGDSKNMMHFVKAFKSMDQIRSFLKSKNLLDKLLTLELEAGNFVEAAGIARLKEDLLMEAHVWEKANSFEKATRLVILDVIMKSLWSHGREGWPPKYFPKREVQFTKAKDLAKKVSSCFYSSVCSELHLWGDMPKITLFKLSKSVREAEESENIRLKFLSWRCLLDLLLSHANEGYSFEPEPALDVAKWSCEIVVQDRVSLNALVYSWVRWQEAIQKVSSSLHEEFCCDYLGVRREENKDVYCVLNRFAGWIEKDVRAQLIKSSSIPCLMSSNQYTSCATSYWKSEMLIVDKAVVKKLESLLRSSHKHTLSPETRVKISLTVYEVIKSLKQSACSTEVIKPLVEDWFWDAIFPLGSKNRANQALQILDCPTAAELVDESLDRILSHTNCNFTYGQLGRLSMILLMSGKLPNDRFGKIVQFAENIAEWQEFFASLKYFFESGFQRKLMVVKFVNALRVTYGVDWRREPDYIPPHCYLYLLDLLTFFASSCLGSVGYMITTRSVLTEIVKLRGCKKFLESPLEMVPEAGTTSGLHSLFEFIVYSVKGLLSSRRKLLEWIHKCPLFMPSNFYSEMVLRLAVTLNLAYLNMGLDIYSAGEFLLGLSDTSRDVPSQFSNKLRQSRDSREGDRSLIAFVDAFASVGDPLVVISAKEDRFVDAFAFLDAFASVGDRSVVISAKGDGFLFPPSSSFFFFCDEMRDKDRVMSVLFPKVVGCDVSKSRVGLTSSTVTTKQVHQNIKEGPDNKQEKLIKMLEAFQGHEKRGAEETIDLLGVLLPWLHKNKPRKSFYDQLSEEIHNVHEHFQEVTVRCKEEHSYPTLQDLYSHWQDGEAKLNIIIDTLLSEKKRKVAAEKKIVEEKMIVAPTVVVKEKVEHSEQAGSTLEELSLEKLEAFLQGNYQVDDTSVMDLLSIVVSLFDKRKFATSFDAQLVEEMKIVYNCFSELPESCRVDGPVLVDLYSKWPRGEIKLKLIVDTLLTSEKGIISDSKEASGSRSTESKMVEEKAADKTGVASSSQPKKNKQNKKNKSKKGRRKNRG